MDTTRPILVAYDGSPDAGLALDWAIAEASATRTGLRLVVVEDVITSPWGISVVHRGEEVLAGARAALEQSGFVDTKVDVLVGHVMEELLRAAHDASTVVVGSRGHGRAEDLLVGSVSQHLARHAPCPVVVVRPESGPRRIVVGVDGSGASTAALAYAFRRADRTGEEVVAIHAWHDPAPSTDVWSADARMATGVPEREVLLAESVAGFRDDFPDVELVQEAVPVSPVTCLVDASHAASLLVVGSHGLGYFRGLLLGSVSQAVLQRATCPVAVVR